MPSKRQHARDRLMLDLQKHACLSTAEIDDLKSLIVSVEYFRRDDHVGGVVNSNEKRYLANGVEYTFDNIPIKKVSEAVESFITMKVPEKERANVFNNVFKGAKTWPDVAKPVIDPHKNPEFEWSVSRAPPESRKSNSQLITNLAEAAELGDHNEKLIAVQITFCDAMGDDKRPPFMLLSADPGVSGGRLGRDHALADVPNHYVRDRLMNYILTQLSEEKRKVALCAVFDDLLPEEIKGYSAAVLKQHNGLNEEVLIPISSDGKVGSKKRLRSQRSDSNAQNKKRAGSVVSTVSTRSSKSKSSRAK